MGMDTVAVNKPVLEASCGQNADSIVLPTEISMLGLSYAMKTVYSGTQLLPHTDNPH